MEINNIWGKLVSELTAQELITLIFAALITVALICIAAYILVRFAEFMLSLAAYLCRKDKYKQFDFAVMRAHRQIAVLRKQVKAATTEKAYYMFYNRLLGVVQFAREMGYISERNVLRMIDVKCNYLESEGKKDDK